MKKIIGIVWFLIVLFGAMHTSAEDNSQKDDFDYNDPKFINTVEMLDMDGHGNDDPATCSVKQQYYGDVAEMFKKGMTKTEILDFYVKELGIHALKAPPAKGFNLVLWVTPFLLILIVFFLVFVILKRWKKNRAEFIKDDVQLKKSGDDFYELLIEQERKKLF
jgi:cytochrome c-type biogenesis protein CcmH